MGKKLLMVVGPTEVEPDVLDAGALDSEYMRTPAYSEKMKNIYSKLQYVFQTKNPVVIYGCSGTGAMEAAVTNFLSSTDRVVYVNGGTFGKRWGEICRIHGVDAVELSVPFGKSIDPALIGKALAEHKGIKAVFTTLDETSSGALTDVKAIGEILRDYPDVLFVVDCVSGLIVEEMQMDDWGVDVAVSSSQKALAIPPGLGFLAASKKALKAAEKSDLRMFYFDILEYVKDWKRGQTPYTPPVSLINQLEIRLEKICDEGLENVRSRYDRNTRRIREGLGTLGFSVFAENPASAVTGCYTEKYNARQVVEHLRNRYDIEIAPSGGTLGEHFFRVGNFGAVGDAEIDRFLASMERTVNELK